MLSTKLGTSRRVIVRLGVVGVVVAVLAAGCSQSEEGTSDGSEPVTSISQTSLSSSAPSSLSPVVPSSTSAEITTTVTQVPVEETTIATTSLPPAEENVPLPEEAFVEDVLSEEAVRLIEAGIDACADLYEFKCARALEDVCFRIARNREELEGRQIREKIDGRNVLYVRNMICRMKNAVHIWEFDAVLLAKYGEEYYSRFSPGFYAFRDNFYKRVAWNSFTDTSSSSYRESYEEFIANYSWDSYMSEAVRLKLHRLVFDLESAVYSAISSFNLETMDVNIANRVLASQQMPEAVRECTKDVWRMSLSDILLDTGYNLYECTESLCETRKVSDDFICYYEGSLYDGIGDQNVKMESGREITIVSLLWRALKYFCAAGETNDNFDPDDSCRRVATNICDITDNLLASFTFVSYYISKMSSCLLAVELSSLPFTNAIIRCLNQIEILVTTANLALVPDLTCADASEKCIEFSRTNERYFGGGSRLIGGVTTSLNIYYPSANCWGYRQYYDYEFIWKNILFLCSENGSLSAFSDSECYNYIQRFCDSTSQNPNFFTFLQDANVVRYSGTAVLDDRFASYINIPDSIYSNDPDKSGREIRRALCSIISDTQTNTSVVNNSIKKYLNLTQEDNDRIVTNPVDTPSFGFRVDTKREYVATRLSYDNINLINSATKECASNSLAPGEFDCAVKLWRSCFDLVSSRSNTKTKGESVRSEISLLAGNVCGSVWIAELGRMASVLSSNFPDDYQAGNFNQFLEYFAFHVCCYTTSAFDIDENGKVHPKMSEIDHLSKYGSPVVNEIMPPLLTSVATYIQIYLPKDVSPWNPYS